MNEIGLSFVKWLQQYRTPAGEDFFFSVTQGGEGVWLLGILGILFWVFGARVAYRAAFSVALGDLVAGALKNIFCIPRPWLRDPSIVPVKAAQWGAYGYSFPSGHTANTALLWGGIGAAFRKWWLWIPILVWIGLVGFSRMYLGVHTPLDVGTSLVLAIPVVWGMSRLYDWTERHPDRAWVVLAAAVLVAVAAWFFLRWRPMPEGGHAGTPKDAYRAIAAMLGLFGAWFVERQYIQFDPKRLGAYRLLAVVVGVAVLSLMMGNLKKLLAPYLGSDAASYVVAASYPFWIFVVWPFLLKGLEKPAPR